MSPLEAAIIRRKLGRMIEALEHLRPIARYALQEYRERYYERKAAERLLQEAIEAALDINAHVIAESGRAVPEDYHAGFLKLAELGILPLELAQELAPAAGLRNRLVHGYDTIDDAKVLAAIGRTLELFPRYVHAVEAMLTKGGL